MKRSSSQLSIEFGEPGRGYDDMYRAIQVAQLLYDKRTDITVSTGDSTLCRYDFTYQQLKFSSVV